MKTDEKTLRVFKEFMIRHSEFENHYGPIEKKIEDFRELSRVSMIKVNERIQVFFGKMNNDPQLVHPDEVYFMKHFIAETTDYLKAFTQFDSSYTTYCASSTKYYETQQKILQTVNDENISKETWHIVYIQKEYLDDLEEMLKNIQKEFAVLSTLFNNLWPKVKVIVYSAEE